MLKGLVPIFGILALLTASVSFADEEKSPRVLIHLLDYVSIDYSAAIANGKVINKLEYDEMQEFAKTLIALHAELPELKGAAGIPEDLKALQALILRKAAPDEVAKAAKDIKWKVVGVTGIQMAPTIWPNLKKGHARYEGTCASCHGVTGQGDGPAGRELDPTPSNFHDGERMAQISPFQAFNAIRLGVPGTGMAAFSSFSDEEIWELAFYVVSLRHQATAAAGAAQNFKADLQQAATRTDAELLPSFQGTASEKATALASLRTRTSTGSGSTEFLEAARSGLQDAQADFANGQFDAARQKALMAYLNGIEPVEPKIRAFSTDLLVEIEERMMSVRNAIERRVPKSDFDLTITNALDTISKCESAVSQKSSPWLTFSVSFGIVLREAFEAILLILTLLGVIKSLGAKKAAYFVHGGWLGAVGVGLVFWFLSGWVMRISGADRELLEGIVSGLAVLVVLYMGFWLHRRTEIGRWRSFINDMLSNVVNTKRLVLLAGISFMAVFREAFETVLFLRAVQLDSAGGYTGAMLAGVLSALVCVLILAAVMLRYSAKVPIRQLFDVSALIMLVLAFTLVGKALHSFQEAGVVSVTPFPLGLRMELLGVFPTYETLIPQALVLTLSLLMWISGRKPELKTQSA